MTTDAPTGQTRCEWCGADYDPATAPPQHPHPKTPAAPAAGAEPATHCEWCGAEFDVPEASAGD